MSSDTQPLHQKEELTLPKGMDLPQKKKKISGYMCLRILLGIYSFFFLLIGLLLVGVGYWVESAQQEYDSINDLVRSPAIVAIVVGGLMVLTAFFGLIGAIREHLCLLKTFLAVIILIFIAQVVVGILAFVYREETERIFTGQIESALENYNENENVQKAVDKVQNKFRCCGIKNGPHDWNLNRNFSCNSTEGICSVPESCCRIPSCNKNDIRKGITDDEDGFSKMKKKGIHVQGCYMKLHIYIYKHLDACGATALGLAIPQILGIFLVYVFIQKVEDRKWLFRDNYKDRRPVVDYE